MVQWSQFVTFASSRGYWRGSLWINVFKRSSSNSEGLPERGVSLMSKRSSLKRENYFHAVLSPLAPIHSANVSGRLRCFRPSIELNEKNMSEMFQFLHLALNFLASTVPFTIFQCKIIDWSPFRIHIDCHFLFEVQLLCLSLIVELLPFEDSEWSRGR